MLRLEVEACERLAPDLDSDAITTGSVTVDGETEEVAWPVVPVAIQGTRAAMRKGSPLVRPVTVSVRIGAPIESAGAEGETTVMERTRAAVAELLEQGPVTGP